MKNLNKKSSNGFTLIEMLVVITIIVLLSGISAFALNAIQQRKQVGAEAERIRAIIAETRSYAMARPDALKDATEIRIKIDASSGISVLSVGATTTDVTSSIALTDTKLPINVKLGASSYEVRIDCANRNMFGNLATGSATEIKVSNKDGSDVYTVKVNDYGYASVSK